MTTPPNPAPRKRGAKGKYNPERVKTLSDALRLGVTVEDACEYAEISQDTYYTWLREKPEFAEAMKKAMSAATLHLVGRIRKEADEGTWQAAAWLLERRFPERWGRRVVQHEGAADKPLKIEVVWTGALPDGQADDDPD